MEERITYSLSKPCSKCNAGVGEECTTPKGRSTSTHQGRWQDISRAYASENMRVLVKATDTEGVYNAREIEDFGGLGAVVFLGWEES